MTGQKCYVSYFSDDVGQVLFTILWPIMNLWMVKQVNLVWYSGSAQHLKNRFGSGYTLTVRCQDTSINQVYIYMVFGFMYIIYPVYL